MPVGREGTNRKKKKSSAGRDAGGGEEGEEEDSGGKKNSSSKRTTTTAAAATVDAITAPFTALGFQPSGGPVVGRSEGAPPEPRPKKSCLLWCCGGKCSCLNSKTSDDTRKQDGRLDLFLNGDGESPPTLDEIRSWSESFDRLMKCSCGRKAFRAFLKCEYSEENILFWQACEDLKREKDPAVVEEKARLIYEDFISILSPKEVSLDSRVRDNINRNMVEPKTNTFDDAQTQIYTLMHRDSYPRFLNSALYKRLAQLNNNGSGTSGTNKETTT